MKVLAIHREEDLQRLAELAKEHEKNHLLWFEQHDETAESDYGV